MEFSYRLLLYVYFHLFLLLPASAVFIIYCNKRKNRNKESINSCKAGFHTIPCLRFNLHIDNKISSYGILHIEGVKNRGSTEGAQREHRGSTEGAQREHRGSTEEAQRKISADVECKKPK
jgi:hypothetical protein